MNYTKLFSIQTPSGPNVVIILRLSDAVSGNDTICASSQRFWNYDNLILMVGQCILRNGFWDLWNSCSWLDEASSVIMHIWHSSILAVRILSIYGVSRCTSTHRLQLTVSCHGNQGGTGFTGCCMTPPHATQPSHLSRPLFLVGFWELCCGEATRHTTPPTKQEREKRCILAAASLAGCDVYWITVIFISNCIKAPG